MEPSIKFKIIWCDEDIFEVKIDVNNGHSIFTNKVYIGYSKFNELLEMLLIFREQKFGGLKDIRLGSFGVEYANGAFSARIHFPEPGNIYISTFQQSDFFDFKKQEVASEAKMYLTTNLMLLDNFIEELKSLISKNCNQIELKGI